MSGGIDINARKLMIEASAGSGKTYQLGARVIALVGLGGVDPERVVALTFTRKAAGEFADSVLAKLAAAATDKQAAGELRKTTGGEVAAGEVLGRIVRALPRFQLGTIDGFFARVVRGFQYELGLTGGAFELLEGPAREAATGDLLAEVLGEALGGDGGDEFLHAFRRATAGKEAQGVMPSLEKFLAAWQGWWRAGMPAGAWGGAAVFGELPEVAAWEGEKGGLISKLRDADDSAPVGKLLDLFEDHTVGSGRLGKAGVLFGRLLEQVPGSAAIELVHGRKTLEFSDGASAVWREMILLLAGCELAAAVARTAAIGELVGRLDDRCERSLRRRGRLGFDDVKELMGRWARDEQARVSREVIDFRLDARHDHWLLDEFQDTSQAEWTGIVGLLDEAAGREDGSLFVVGDRKQAIYGWRGGDVRLFDEVERRFGADGELEVRSMPRSWRSCPAVLELVNRVCGDKAAIGSLFGGGLAERWPWEEHSSAKPDLSGEARVEVVAKGDKDKRLVELLQQLGVGSRELTCGVLVRTNRQVRSVAALLREHGFDVIEEGCRQPVADNPAGVALLHLVRWLADPADRFASEIVSMSPLAVRVEERFGEPWQKAWEGMLRCAAESGFAATVEELIEPLWGELSEFARRRVGDVIGALAEFDASGGSSARQAVRWLTDLEISQSPGVAAVQVMTVHKAKGLGFDVVILPEVEDEQVPNRGGFEVASGTSDGSPWLLQPPPDWVRDLVPPLALVEGQWSDDQRYEMLCVLYVALTRAKRGLYVLLPEVPKSRKNAELWASPANLVVQACGPSEEGVLFQAGDADWFKEVDQRVGRPRLKTPALREGTALRGRSTPSAAKGEGGPASGRPGGGLAFGREVHGLFEQIGWLDEGTDRLGEGKAAALVRECLEVEEIAGYFRRREGVEVFREQAVEVILDGRWMSGVIDRLLIERDGGGRVISATVVDFKTDRVETEAELAERHGGQMLAYRKALSDVLAVKEDAIDCVLVSTALKKVIKNCGE